MMCRNGAYEINGSTEIICPFVQVDSLRERDNLFIRMAKQTTDLHNWRIHTKLTLMTMWPAFCEWLGMRLFSAQQNSYFNRMVHATIGYRERNGIVRPDLIQLLMDARRGFLQYDETTSRGGVDAEGFACTDEIGSEDLCGFQKRFWDDEDVTAQCCLFVFIGSESTSSMLSFAVYELMANPLVQERLIAELDEAKRRLNGETVTYDVLTGLKYLDMVVTGEFLVPPSY